MAQCNGTTHRHGEPRPCAQPAMKGQTVCKSHGGLAPQNMAAAARRIAEQKAQALLDGTPLWNPDATPTTDPVSELGLLAGQLRDLRDKLGAQIEAKDECPCCGRGDYDHVTTSMFKTVLRESGSLLTNMARLGLEDRRIKIEERKVDMVIVAVMAGLNAAGIADDEPKMLAARQAVVSRMHELEAVPFTLGT